MHPEYKDVIATDDLRNQEMDTLNIVMQKPVYTEPDIRNKFRLYEQYILNKPRYGGAREFRWLASLMGDTLTCLEC